jgi:hypothetical protein
MSATEMPTEAEIITGDGSHMLPSAIATVAQMI